MQPANVKLLEELAVLFSQMLVDFPQLKEVDINPLFLTDKEAFAFDARIVIDKDMLLAQPEPHQHLVITPYPKKYETVWKLRDGRSVLLRPIKPEDEPMWLEMFQTFSEESIRYRFFQVIKDTSHEMRVRYCNIDYDREVAIVAEMTENGKRRILGVARVGLEPDAKTGEIAFIVADPWQGLGLGTKMVDHAIEICKDMKVESLYAIMIRDNVRAINLMKKMGFEVHYLQDGTARGVLNLEEEERPLVPARVERVEQAPTQVRPVREQTSEPKDAEAIAN
jgi:acetyltransferase